MDIKSFITEIGGRKSVIEETGLTKGRISQWVIENKLTRPWILYFQIKYPEASRKYGVEITKQDAA